MNRQTAETVTAPAYSASSMAKAMEEAHTRLCLVAVELIAEHFIWKTPEARELIEALPPLRDTRLDSILTAIRQGAAHPADCKLEYAAYLAKILVESQRIRDFELRRNRIDAYQRRFREYSLINQLAAAWQDQERDTFAATLDRLCQCANEAEGPDPAELFRTQVANAPDVPEPLFPHGPAPGGFGLIIGADGVGKGWLTLDLMLGCVLARPLNVPVFQRVGAPLRVLYLCYEDDPRVLRWRLDRVCECAGISPQAWRDAEQDGRLHFAVDLLPLFVQGSHGAPAPSPTFHALAKTLKKQAIDLCIIDPLAAAAVLQSENDNSALNAVAVALRELARDTGSALLLTHHTSKANRDEAGHHASRGGSALTGAARWVLRLIQQPGDRNRLTAGIPKNSYGPGLAGITLQRLDQGVLRELSETALNQHSASLVERVVRFVTENPDMEINPNAIPCKASQGAKALIAYLDTSPAAAARAVEKALESEQLQVEERHRPNSRKRFSVLIPWQDNNAEEIPF